MEKKNESAFLHGPFRPSSVPVNGARHGKRGYFQSCWLLTRTSFRPENTEQLWGQATSPRPWQPRGRELARPLKVADGPGVLESQPLPVFSRLHTLHRGCLNDRVTGFPGRAPFLPQPDHESLLTAEVQMRRWNGCHGLFAGLSGRPAWGRRMLGRAVAC